MSEVDTQFMRRALELAARAEAEGEVPVGAVLVHEGEIVGEGYNRPISTRDATAHAEMLALREACGATGAYRLPAETTLYVTLEPCPMCAGAMVHARVDRLVYGAEDPKSGAAGSLMDLLRDPRLNHRLEVQGGVLAEACGEQLRVFFRARR